MSSLLEREILEQGSVLANRARPGMTAAEKAAELLRGAGHIVIAARGSSDNAARFAQYLFGEELRLQVGLAAPWLYRDVDRAPVLSDAAVIAISQSGRSPDILAVLKAARAQGRPILVISNDPESEMAKQADVLVPLLTGAERSVAATKTYLASLHAIVQIVQALAPSGQRADWLSRLPDEVGAMAEKATRRRAEFDILGEASPVTVTGRGLFYSTASESALKIRELSGTTAEAFSPPDLLHGPIAALHPPAGTWLISPGEELEEIAQRLEPMVIVSSEEPMLSRARIPVPLPPGYPDWAKAILATVPAQAAGLRLAERAGIDIDRPHGLQKVTLTS